MEREFVSELEKMISATELCFPPSPGFGKYREFLEHAVSHPAKMNVNLLEFLILNFTREGEIILDPMAGSGSLGVIASLHGRNAIQVDIEKKFYEFMEVAREKVEKHPTLAPKGWIKNICGDARQLSMLLNRADAIITSPPYLKSAESGAGVNRQREGDVKIGCSTIGRMVAHLNAIDNTKEYGSIVDTIITSPPYTNRAFENPNVIELQKKGWVHGGDIPKFFQNPISEDNLENLPFGNLKSSDEEYKMITRNQTKEDNRKKEERETYLEAMLKIYGEMFKILRHGGRAIIIVRPFVRGKRPIDLPYHTWLLLQKVGFRLEKLYKLRLKNQSFWRILYYKRHPDAPRICHEYILICRKPSMP